MNDPVNHPSHYTAHPSGIECIQITEHMGFNLGNAIKYIWRADLKGAGKEDLEKAAWYLAREIARRKNEGKGGLKKAEPLEDDDNEDLRKASWHLTREVVKPWNDRNEDLRRASWFLEKEVARRRGTTGGPTQ